MKRTLFIFIILFNTSKYRTSVEACFATQPASNPTVSTTEEPVTNTPELRTCSTDLITFEGLGGNTEVTHFGYSYTAIPGTQETLSTVKISCQAMDGYYVNMGFENNGQPKENNDMVQNITIEATCNSQTMQWIYSTTVDDGSTVTFDVTEVTCLQVPNPDQPELRMCSTDDIMFGQGDGKTPEQQIDVSHFGYTYTAIPGTVETTSTVKISCQAIDGYIVAMDFPAGQAKENGDNVQNITVEVTCNSETMDWIYSVPLPDGSTYSVSVTEVTCLQAPNPDQPELRKCSTDDIMFGQGDGENPQQQIDVSHFGYTYTAIPGTLETTSTVKISCQAIDGYIVAMEFPTGQAKENGDNVQNITVEVTCNSEAMDWIYSVPLPDGSTYSVSVTEVTCLQAPNPDQPELRMCSTDDIAFAQGDGENPQQEIEVTHFGYTYTAIPGTIETTSTVKISCQAIDGYYVNMDFAGNTGDGQAKENNDKVQNITVAATCNSQTMEWIYSAIQDDGSPYTFSFTGVACLQLPVDEEPEQKRCAPLTITPGNGQRQLDITTTGITYTPIPGTEMDTTTTMTLSCTALTGYKAFMSFGNRNPQENGEPNGVQTVTITVACSSVDGIWRYTTVLPNGNPYSEPITMVGCTQNTP